MLERIERGEMGDGVIGKVKGSEGKEYHVKWEGGSVPVK